MSLDDAQRRALLRKLGLTRTEELDCDQFLQLLPAELDDRLDDARLAALMEHHRTICPECEEEREILRRALGRQ